MEYQRVYTTNEHSRKALRVAFFFAFLRCCVWIKNITAPFVLFLIDAQTLNNIDDLQFTRHSLAARRRTRSIRPVDPKCKYTDTPIFDNIDYLRVHFY